MPFNMQPLPVIRLIIGQPFSARQNRRPSVTRSLGPVMMTMVFVARARFPALIKHLL